MTIFKDNEGYELPSDDIGRPYFNAIIWSNKKHGISEPTIDMYIPYLVGEQDQLYETSEYISAPLKDLLEEYLLACKMGPVDDDQFMIAQVLENDFIDYLKDYVKRLEKVGPIIAKKIERENNNEKRRSRKAIGKKILTKGKKLIFY